MSPLQPGASVLGAYILEAPIASGAMGEVWRASGPEGQRLAVKFASPDGAARAESEARALAALSHPHVVPFVAAGAHEGRAALVMAFVDGPSLRDRLRQGPMPVDEAVRVARAIAVGLAHAHERGVVHRDVKASNVLLPPAGPAAVLIDFGLGLVQGSARLSSSDVVLGSVHTMPPEQMQGLTADGRADVYGVGALLFRMVVCAYPYQASSTVQVLAMHAHARIPRFAERLDRVVEVPAGLEGLVARCLAKDPAARPTAAELVVALDALPRGEWVSIEPSGEATPAAPRGRPEPPPPRRPLAMMAVASAVSLGAAALGLWWWWG